MKEPYQIIDISQPISTKSACFPGDTPFEFSVKISYGANNNYNVTAFNMSPHIGTHVDAPAHVLKEMEEKNLVASLPLTSFIGPCYVIDLSPHNAEILLMDIEKKLPKKNLPPRVLFRTRIQSSFDVFDEKSAYLSLEVINFLKSKGVCMVGIDAPSVDSVSSKTLDIHHALISHRMVWLENLDLTLAEQGTYFLSALPIKLIELEAAPVRAVLLKFNSN